MSGMLEKYVQLLQGAIDNVKLKNGNFATSATVNQDAKLISEDLYQKIAKYFRDLGYIVHGPPSLTTFQMACANYARNNMQLTRWDSRPETLDHMILVEIKDEHS